MDKWVITYNGIDGKDILMNEYETIEGKNAMDALNKKFGKSFERATGDFGRYADVILIKGYFMNNNIHAAGRPQRLCYIIKR